MVVAVVDIVAVVVGKKAVAVAVAAAVVVGLLGRLIVRGVPSLSRDEVLALGLRKFAVGKELA